MIRSIYRPDFDGPLWRAVHKLYLDDKVVEAYEEAEALGGSRSDNHYFAEAEARTRGEQLQLRTWLTLEFIRDEIADLLNPAAELIATDCEDLSRRFDWDNREATLVTVLPQDTDQSWMPGRWGYYIDKTPYDKIVLPHHVIQDQNKLSRTIRHEFMHTITHNLTNAHAPHWLGEAMSTYAEGYLDRRHLAAIQSDAAEWLSPVDVGLAVTEDKRDESQSRAISDAYSQSNLVGRYLASLGGDAKLAEFLTAMGEQSFMAYVEQQLLGRRPIERALRKVYGINESQLFGQAHAWARAVSSRDLNH